MAGETPGVRLSFKTPFPKEVVCRQVLEIRVGLSTEEGIITHSSADDFKLGLETIDDVISTTLFVNVLKTTVLEKHIQYHLSIATDSSLFPSVKMVYVRIIVQATSHRSHLLTAHSPIITVYDDTIGDASAIRSSKHSDVSTFRRVGEIWILEAPETFGFCAVLWDAEVRLFQEVQKHLHSWCEKSILELGASTGLAGLACARVAKVTIADEAAMIPFCQLNARENELLDRVQFLAHKWGDVIGLDVPVSAFEEKRGYDVILGSDLLYDPAYYDDLWTSLGALSHSASVVILCLTLRNDMEMSFFSLAAAANWDICISDADDGSHTHKVVKMSRRN